MRDAVLAAVLCGLTAVAGWTLWSVVDRLLGGVLVVPGLDAGLTRLLVAPPLACAAASAFLTWAHADRPWLGPALGGLTVAAVGAFGTRLLTLVSMTLRLSMSGAALLLLVAGAGWWGWVVAPGRSLSVRLGCPLLLLVLALADRAFAARWELAAMRREIVATGLRPWIVDDPAWVLDYVYVPPDRRSINVGYESPERDNSLSVELVRAEVGTNRGTATYRHRGAPWAGGAAGADGPRGVPRYVTNVGDDQVVRMELDHGEAHDPEIARLATRLRPADPSELAQRDAAGLV